MKIQTKLKQGLLLLFLGLGAVWFGLRSYETWARLSALPPSDRGAVGRFVPTQRLEAFPLAYDVRAVKNTSEVLIVDTTSGAIYEPYGEPWEIEKWLKVRKGIEEGRVYQDAAPAASQKR